MSLADELRTLVVEGQRRGVEAPIRGLLDDGMTPTAIVEDVLRGAMLEVGDRFARGDFYLPDLLLAGRAMKTATDYLRPHLAAGDGPKQKGTVVIGTVKGDIHDIGKNLVATMLEGAGYRVVDLGTDTSAEGFIAAIREHDPQVVAFSALLSTTMATIPGIIKAIEAAGLRDGRLMAVGGAPLTEAFASAHGIDLYARDAGTAVQVFDRGIGTRLGTRMDTD